MKYKYTSTPTGDKNELNDLEFQDMMIPHEQKQTINETQEKQRQRLQQPLWKRIFYSSGTRNMWIIVLLIFLVGVSVIGYIYHHTSRTNNMHPIKKPGVNSDFAVEIENSEEQVSKQLTSIQDDNNNENEGERLPRLRSFSRDEGPYPPEIVGHINLYFRKTRNGGSRQRIQRLRFPVARYNRRYFPLNGPFIGFMPPIRIFADRDSKQTIIYSKRKIYVLPWLMDRYEKRFSIAALIASGYASLSPSGVRPSRTINMVSLFRPNSLMGRGIPRINPYIGGFMGGIHTNYGPFVIPRYPEIVFNIDSILELEDEEEEEDTYRHSSDRYDSDERPYLPLRPLLQRPLKYPSYKNNYTTKSKPATATMATTAMTIIIGAAPTVDNQTQAILQGDSYLQRDAFFQASDYMFDYSGTKQGNSLRIIQQYGNATFIEIPQTASLIGSSLGSTRFDLKSCALLQPHTHRADVQIYVLEGRIRAGFVIQSFGKLIENNLDVGKGMIFPRGSLMYFENLSSQNRASFIASYSSNDFGVDLMIPLLFNSLPRDIVRIAMGGLSTTDYENIKNKVPNNQIYAVNQECLKENSF